MMLEKEGFYSGFNSKNDAVYIGIDETNHGSSPEIFVAAFSFFKNDSQEKDLLNKIRDHKNIETNFLKARDYSFFISFNPPRYSDKFLGDIVSRLICPKLKEYFFKLPYNRRLDIFVDGILSDIARNSIKDCVSKDLKTKRRRVRVLSGKRFDEKFKIVNLADQVANYLLHNYNTNSLLDHPNRVV